MQSKITKVKVSINRSYLKSYLFRFFRNLNISSNYVFVITKINIKNDSMIIIGHKTAIDLSIKGEIYSYVNNVTERFSSLKDKKFKPGDTIFIHYIESSQEEYNKFISELLSSKTLNISNDEL